MNTKTLVLLIVIPVALVVAAASLRWGYKAQEVTFSSGPVRHVSATATETIIELNPDNTDPVTITDTEGAANIRRAPGFERIVLNQKGMESNSGQVLVPWKNPVQYIPTHGYRVFSRRVYLGRLETQTGAVKDFYLPKP
ncbi:MAG: hypothetical protein ACFUZC_05595 [Chthoniobacteraceae bacterium]